MSKLFTVGPDRKLVERTPDGRGMSMPVGSLMMFAGENPPESWLLCDGSEVSRSIYTALFNVIGTTFGPGNGSTTFNLPDLRGRFVQGATIAGDVREAGLPNITGSLSNLSNAGTIIPSRYQDITSSGALSTGTAAYSSSIQYTAPGSAGTGLVNFNASESNSIYGNSVTVQPPAVTMIPCIKAFGSVVTSESLVSSSTIIYPNGGSAGAEANVSANQRIVMDNPFPGYFVQCVAQIKVNNYWGATGWAYDTQARTYGILANQLSPDDKIVVQSGNSYVSTVGTSTGTPIPNCPVLTTAPCRVIVHRMGKM